MCTAAPRHSPASKPPPRAQRLERGGQAPGPLEASSPLLPTSCPCPPLDCAPLWSPTHRGPPAARGLRCPCPLGSTGGASPDPASGAWVAVGRELGSEEDRGHRGNWWWGARLWWKGGPRARQAGAGTARGSPFGTSGSSPLNPDAEALEADAQLVSAPAPLPQGTEGVPFLSGLTAGTSVSIAVTTAWS